MDSVRTRPSRAVNSGVSPSVLLGVLEKLHSSTPGRNFAGFYESGSIRPGGGSLPDLCSSPAEFAVAYLESELLSKYDDGKSSDEKEAKAWERFTEAEESCRLTNEKFRKPQSWYSLKSTGTWSLIEAATRKIAVILGDFDWDEAALGFGFGPGASRRLPRRRAHPVYKYSGTPEATEGCLGLAIACISSIGPWQGVPFEGRDSIHVKIVDGNKAVTVPKNYKTNRCIAIEPDMNTYVQRGIGQYMRRRLRYAGIDLTDQTRNQRLALVGSLGNSLATIDLSMASDTVAYKLVEALLPPDWFLALEQCRSPTGVLPSGRVVTYEKFSSMGNGYTFELETLIFYALALAVREAYGVEDTRVSVYGDDIVVPSSMAEPLISLLREVGFTPNESKTFFDGPFRESCGKHYFKGHEVTPFYVRRPVDKLTDLFLLHNNLRRWIRRTGAASHLSSTFEEICEWLRARAPSNWRRPRIPDGVGDGAFIGSFDEARPKAAGEKRKYYGWEGWLCEVLVEISISPRVTMPTRLLHSLVALSRSPIHSDLEPGDPIVGQRYGVRKIVVTQFADGEGLTT